MDEDTEPEKDAGEGESATVASFVNRSQQESMRYNKSVRITARAGLECEVDDEALAEELDVDDDDDDDDDDDEEGEEEDEEEDENLEEEEAERDDDEEEPGAAVEERESLTKA